LGSAHETGNPVRQEFYAGIFLLKSQANIEALLLLRRDVLLLLLFLLHLRRMDAAVRHIMPQRRSQLLAVAGEDLRVLCAARDGNVIRYSLAADNAAKDQEAQLQSSAARFHISL
jgi:hypothetical protein